MSEPMRHLKHERCIDCTCCNVREMKCFPNDVDCHAEYDLDWIDLFEHHRCDFFVHKEGSRQTDDGKLAKYLSIADRNLSKAVRALKNNRHRPGITEQEIENLKDKVEYAAVVRELILGSTKG